MFIFVTTYQLSNIVCRNWNYGIRHNIPQIWKIWEYCGLKKLVYQLLKDFGMTFQRRQKRSRIFFAISKSYNLWGKIKVNYWSIPACNHKMWRYTWERICKIIGLWVTWKLSKLILTSHVAKILCFCREKVHFISGECWWWSRCFSCNVKSPYMSSFASGTLMYGFYQPL